MKIFSVPCFYKSDISPRSAANLSGGFTLIEVMIGLALSLIAMIVVLQVFSLSDARKKVTVGGAEAQQIANVANFQQSRVFRIGGSGLLQALKTTGCTIEVWRSNAQILPAASAFPAPFGAVSQIVRAIPVLIYPGPPDVIVSLAGASQSSTVEYDFASVPLATGVSVINSNGIRQMDLLLATKVAVASPDECRVVQADTTYPVFSAGALSSQTISTQVLPGVVYNTAAGLTGSDPPFDLNSRLLNLGQDPAFHMYGVDAQQRLVQNDLLQLNGAASAVLAENIVDLQAIYGVDTNGDGVVDSWEQPTGAWAPSALSTGTNEAALEINKILAVRVALVVRSAESAADAEPKAAYKIFTDLGGTIAKTVAIPIANQKRRHIVFETVVPIRNQRYVVR